MGILQSVYLCLVSLFICLSVFCQSAYSQKHLDTAQKYLYVREITENRGPEIDLWNKSNNSPLGSSYCCNFGQYCLRQAGASNPISKSGLAQNTWKNAKKGTKHTYQEVINRGYKVRKGDVIIFQKGLTQYGHFAFSMENWKYSEGKTIEANTSGNNKGNQSNGDGVYFKYRKIQPLAYFKIRGFIEVIY